jgi:hypothetical protein
MEKALAEGVGRVVVMMVMDFDFTEAGAAETGDAVDVRGVVFVDREEEGMPRWAAVGVAKAFEEARVVLDPALNTRRGAVGVDVAVLRFVVVGDAEEEVDRITTAWNTPI